MNQEERVGKKESSPHHISQQANKYTDNSDIRRQLVKEITFVGLGPKKRCRFHPEYSFTRSAITQKVTILILARIDVLWRKHRNKNADASGSKMSGQIPQTLRTCKRAFLCLRQLRKKSPASEILLSESNKFD